MVLEFHIVLINTKIIRKEKERWKERKEKQRRARSTGRGETQR